MRGNRKFLVLSILLSGVFFLTNCNGGSGSGETAPVGTVVSKSAVLGGAEEVPPVTTSASGSGILDVNTTTGAVSGRLTIGTSPTTTIITANVHEGVRGANGSIVIILENSGSGVWIVPAGSAMSPAQVNLFTAGSLYFNVHTFANPSGEVRGQIDGAVAPAGASRLIYRAAASRPVSMSENKLYSRSNGVPSGASAGE